MYLATIARSGAPSARQRGHASSTEEEYIVDEEEGPEYAPCGGQEKQPDASNTPSYPPAGTTSMWKRLENTKASLPSTKTINIDFN